MLFFALCRNATYFYAMIMKENLRIGPELILKQLPLNSLRCQIAPFNTVNYPTLYFHFSFSSIHLTVPLLPLSSPALFINFPHSPVSAILLKSKQRTSKDFLLKPGVFKKECCQV